MNDLIARAVDALGIEDVSEYSRGGQKTVLRGRLSGADAIAKIVLIPPTPNGRAALKRARREVELLASIDSARVVRLLTDSIDVGDPLEAICWVEEYLDGIDLQDDLSHGWTEADLRQLLYQTSQGLVPFHEQSIAHRDLSPGNIRKTSRGFVIMDPGLARHIARTAMTGTFNPGTIGWISPEHLPGVRVLPASDVFVLGLLAYHAATATDAYDYSIDTDDYLAALAAESAPSVSLLRPDLTPETIGIIDRCLRPQPARRFLDGAELLEHLDNLGWGK